MRCSTRASCASDCATSSSHSATHARRRSAPAPGAAPAPVPRLSFARALHAIYLASGAAALLYEIAWTRLLTLEFGHTVASASAVLAAFMGGLAAGAALGGRFSSRLTGRQALRTYALLELATGAYAVIVPLLVEGARSLLAPTYGEHGGAWFAILRVALALVIVGIPATWMGATYPLMLRSVQPESSARGSRGGSRAPEAPRAASLYAVNTLGAAGGAVLTGFVLLPAVGMFRTLIVGAAANVALAAMAWRLSGSLGTDVAPGQPSGAAVRPQDAPAPLAAAALVVALSGAAALALEIAWTRVLAMILGPTTYAFSAMLASFIVALAAGAGAATRVARRTARPETWLAAALAGCSIAVVAAAVQVEDEVLSVARLAAQPAATLRSMIAAQLWTALRLLGPIAFCFGAVFPLALRVAGAAASARRAGLLYAANTAGAIAGALLAGFALIPYWGLQGTLRAAVVVTAVAAAAVLTTIVRRSPVTAASIGLAAAAAAVASLRVPWDPKLLSAGGYKYAPYLGAAELDAVLTAGRLHYYAEGAASTIAVRDVAGVRSLAIDGKVDASTGGDMPTQRLLAHLPLLLHGSASRVGIVGLGSGVTAASALTHGVTRVDVVEISKEVVEAARWFERESGQALRDPRMRVIVGDARTHFRLGRSRYDVIISEPSNPWVAGVASLFTREFFDSLRASLAPGGVVCQWTQTYDLTPADLRSIVATFVAVFPRTTMWLVGDGDLLLAGAVGLEPGLERLSAGFERAAVARDLAGIGVTSPAVLTALMVGGAEDAAQWSRGAEIQRDDRLALEFSAPAENVGRSRHDNATELRSAWRRAKTDTVPAAAALDVGLMQLAAEAPQAAWPWLSNAGEALIGNGAALKAFTRAAAATGKVPEAGALLEKLVRQHPHDAAVRVELSRLLFATGRKDDALAAARAAASIDAVAAAEQEASIAADLQDVELLSTAVRQLERLAPASHPTAYYRATLALLSGSSSAAVADALRVTELNAADARGWNLLGNARGAAQAPRDRIRDAFVRAVQADPRDPTGYVNLGLVELQSGNAAAASEHFAEALVLDPANAAARDGLAAARRR